MRQAPKAVSPLRAGCQKGVRKRWKDLLLVVVVVSTVSQNLWRRRAPKEVSQCTVVVNVNVQLLCCRSRNNAIASASMKLTGLPPIPPTLNASEGPKTRTKWDVGGGSDRSDSSANRCDSSAIRV